MASPPAPGPESEALTIQIVEDDEDARTNLCDILELQNHRVFAAGSFAETLIAGHLAAVDVVILDRNLPDGMAEDVLPDFRDWLTEAWS